MRIGFALVAVCAALASSPGRAEEVAVWQLFDEGEVLSAIFGVPESDYVEISLSCRPKTPDITIVYVAGLPRAKTGLRTNILLVDDGVEYRIPVVGTRSDMDDSFVLEGTFRMEPPARRLFQDRGRFTVKLGGEADRTYSFETFREEIARFVDTCR